MRIVFTWIKEINQKINLNQLLEFQWGSIYNGNFIKNMGNKDVDNTGNSFIIDNINQSELIS